MTIRPLGISLLIHLLAFGIFLFLLTHNTFKKPPEPLKIHIAAFIPPTTVQAPTPTPPTPMPIVPPKQTPPPIQKNTPPPPVAVAKPIPSTVVPVPVTSRPTPPVPQPIQPLTQAPAPKVIEAPKAPPPPPPPVNVEKEFLNAHLGEIRGQLLQNFKYPKMAQKLKMQGEVKVSFSLSSEGKVDNIKVSESSGFDILDEDAMALIEKTASTFPKPSKSVRITVPLSYVLR
ncbi:MAG: TonB family protein [Sulfurimonas sp.]|jgi:protein TonB